MYPANAAVTNIEYYKVDSIETELIRIKIASTLQSRSYTRRLRGLQYKPESSTDEQIAIISSYDPMIWSIIVSMVQKKSLTCCIALGDTLRGLSISPLNVDSAKPVKSLTVVPSAI
jgi:hypothetical protein